MPPRAPFFLLAVALLTAMVWWLGQQLAPDLAANRQKNNDPRPASGSGMLAPELGGSSANQEKDQTRPPAPNPYEQAEIKSQIMQVADLYSEASRYPHYSQPILDTEKPTELAPFEQTEVDTPFPKANQEGEPLRLQLATDRFHYFSGDTITARLRLLNVSPDLFVSATGVIAGQQGDTNLAAEFLPTGVPNEYLASFDTVLASAQKLSTEMLLKVEAKINQDTVFTTTSFRYQQADAKLIAVPWARPEGAFLNIALQYDVVQAGYYFARAILVDAETQRPLLELQAEGPMQLGSGLLTLRAHVDALKAAGSEGPYVLRSINSYRGAEQGEAFDSPAGNLQQRYEVPGYDFDQYSNEEFVDPLAQERAEFLRELGSVAEQESEE